MKSSVRERFEWHEFLNYPHPLSQIPKSPTQISINEERKSDIIPAKGKCKKVEAPVSKEDEQKIAKSNKVTITKTSPLISKSDENCKIKENHNKSQHLGSLEADSSHSAKNNDQENTPSNFRSLIPVIMNRGIIKTNQGDMIRQVALYQFIL